MDRPRQAGSFSQGRATAREDACAWESGHVAGAARSHSLSDPRTPQLQKLALSVKLNAASARAWPGWPSLWGDGPAVSLSLCPLEPSTPLPGGPEGARTRIATVGSVPGGPPGRPRLPLVGETQHPEHAPEGCLTW